MLVLYESEDIDDDAFRATIQRIGEIGKHLLELVEKLEETIENHPDEKP